MALNILVVDDSTAIRKILIRVLRQTALAIGEIFEARDGVEALEIVRNHPLNLVLSDINMPNLDGLGLLAELKGTDQWRDLPVVMITTEGSEEKVEPGDPSGFGRLHPEALHRRTDPGKDRRPSLTRSARLPTWPSFRPPSARIGPAWPGVYRERPFRGPTPAAAARAKIFARVTGSWRRPSAAAHSAPFSDGARLALPRMWHAEPFVGHAWNTTWIC